MVLNEAGCSRSPRPCHSAREVLTAGAASSRSWLKVPAVAAARGAPAHPDDRDGRRAQMAQGTLKRFNLIAPGDGAPDVSLHHSAVEADGYRSPRSTSASRRRFLTAGYGAERD